MRFGKATTFVRKLTLSLALFVSISSHAAVPDPVRIQLNNESFLVPKACKASVDKIISALHDYAYASYWNRGGEAKRNHRTIQAILKSLPVENDCKRWGHVAYVLGSLSLYNHRQNNGALSLIHLAIPLYNERKFIPLDSKLRNEWGGEWKKPNRIMGAYECERTEVYFDSTLPPYDVGAVIAHELEHLMRDKYTFSAADSPFLKDVASAVLLDELISSLHAGYLQISLMKDSLRQSKNELTSSFLSLDVNGLSFNKRRALRLSDDLDLFKKRGHLYRIWSKGVKSGDVGYGMLFSEFFAASIFPVLIGSAEDKDNRSGSAIIKIINQAYFDGKGPSSEHVVDTLLSWQNSDPNLTSPLGSLLRSTSNKAIHEKKDQPWNDFWHEYQTKLANPTQGCLKVKKAIISGGASGYIGSKLGTVYSSGGEGGRPTGGEGGRPSVPLTPCLLPSEGL